MRRSNDEIIDLDEFRPETPTLELMEAVAKSGGLELPDDMPLTFRKFFNWLVRDARGISLSKLSKNSGIERTMISKLVITPSPPVKTHSAETALGGDNRYSLLARSLEVDERLFCQLVQNFQTYYIDLYDYRSDEAAQTIIHFRIGLMRLLEGVKDQEECDEMEIGLDQIMKSQINSCTQDPGRTLEKCYVQFKREHLGEVPVAIEVEMDRFAHSVFRQTGPIGELNTDIKPSTFEGETRPPEDQLNRLLHKLLPHDDVESLEINSELMPPGKMYAYQSGVLEFSLGLRQDLELILEGEVPMPFAIELECLLLSIANHEYRQRPELQSRFFAGS
ncbi:hypothetical protein HOG48_00635 [Candidatus Peregrinibacteria bacterium]|jgi:hypothetical protein|nr:hypothetical protein [Candidatus Peregrinibacteria bacterium]